MPLACEECDRVPDDAHGWIAKVVELLGDSKRVAAEHYVHALTDYREAEYSSLR